MGGIFTFASFKAIAAAAAASSCIHLYWASLYSNQAAQIDRIFSIIQSKIIHGIILHV